MAFFPNATSITFPVYTTAAGTANAYVPYYGPPLQQAPAAPRDEDAVSWLRRQVDEITEIAA